MCKGIFKSEVLSVLRGLRWWSNMDVNTSGQIVGSGEEYEIDRDSNAINLIVDSFKDDTGNPWVLPSVRKAEDIVHERVMNHEYSPVDGEEEFTEPVARLALGEDNVVLKEKSSCTVQTVSGTGALRLGLDFIKNYFAKNKEVWLSNPTWSNHAQICKAVGLPYKQYRYLDRETKGLDFEGAYEDITNIPEGSVILLHACGHNPTGVDPSYNQWQELSKLILVRNLFPFFDMAYQGLVTGDLDRDATALRLFVNAGHHVMLAQSFASNMGLYGERAGALTFLCGDSESAANVKAHVKKLIQTMYLNPPLYSARLVSAILNDPELKEQWLNDVKHMACRITAMRSILRKRLEEKATNFDWEHITKQCGMFSYTGLSPKQVDSLAKNHHVYLTREGRMSMANVNNKNVNYLAEAISKVVG